MADDVSARMSHEEPSVMMIFAQYFGANHHSFSDKQLRRLGEWINTAVLLGGNLENAIATCFLEHSKQLKINRTLAPTFQKRPSGRHRARAGEPGR